MILFLGFPVFSFFFNNVSYFICIARLLLSLICYHIWTSAFGLASQEAKSELSR